MSQVMRYIEMWASWQSAWSAAGEVGFPDCSPMFKGSAGGVAGDDTFDLLCEQSDTWVAKAVDAIIDDLPPIERSAIYHRHLDAVFRGPDLEAAYERAIEAVEQGMRGEGLG